MFELHAQLQADTYVIGKFALSWVLLHKDATYPWVILVPARNDLQEIYHLDSDDQVSLLRESCHLSEIMVDLFAPKKLNIAAIGNLVSQLHLHHVARFDTDPAWPKPIWGLLPATPYTDELRDLRINQLRCALQGKDFIVQDVCN
jgi:diadenosine tetraphosphate (Ap4A) HIT family hydrolase